MIAYKYGKIPEIEVKNIENNLSTKIEKSEEMKKDLLLILKKSKLTEQDG